MTKQEEREYKRQWYLRNKERHKEKVKKWREENKDYILEYGKKWREENKDYFDEYNSQYYKENKEEIKKRSKEHRENNKDYYVAYNKKYVIDNKESINSHKLKYTLSNPDKVKESRKKYYNNNTEKVKNRYNQYRKNKRINDPLYKMIENIRCLIRYSFLNSGFQKSSRTFEILGCSYEEFKSYIESQFEDWMSFENHGPYTGGYNETWQYDHIIPISLASSPEEVIKLNHYTNFRPLCSKKNLEKSNNL